MAETSPEHMSYAGPPKTPEATEEETEALTPLELEPGYFPSASEPEEPSVEAPSYAPGETPPYAPYAPEAADFEARTVEAIRGVVERANLRAQERYGKGPLGKVRSFFRREGTRTEAETLEQVGNWQKNPKWKKWALFGAKMAGGAGVAAAMVATGGAGAVLTPILWSAGMREAWDGTLEAVEELGWGRKRSHAELDAQAVVSEKITTLKESVGSPDINETRFAQLLNEMLDAENSVISSEQTNIKGERKGKLVRSIASTVLTIGTGLMAGVPLGTHDYDKGATEAAKISLDESHRVMWNLHGGHFLYNSLEELARVAGEAAKHGYDLTLHGVSGIDTYGQLSHTLGHGLPIAEKIGLATTGAYQIARNLIDFLPSRRRRRTDEGEPYASYGPSYPTLYGGPTYGPSYGPDSSYAGGAASGGRTSSETESKSEKDAIDKYLAGLGAEHVTKLRELGKELPIMDENCKFAVCIPASYAEHAVIYHTLEQYLNQKELDDSPLASENFEINIFVNGPEDKQSDVAKTVQEIERFKKDHPELKVNCISKVFQDKTTIGALRKDLNDLTILRGTERKNVLNPLNLVSNDADVNKIDPHYFAKAERVFQENPEIKMLAGKDDFPEKEYQQYPYLLAARRLWQFADIVMRHRKYSDFLPKTVGRNSFIRAESYAEAGGYRQDAWVAEDLDLARDVASKNGAQAIDYRNISIVTSSRRDMAMIEKGVPIVRAYEDFGARESFRGKKPQPIALEKLTPDNPQFTKRLEKEASAVYNDLYKRFFWATFDQNSEVRQRRSEQGRSADISDLQKKLKKDPRYGGEAARKTGQAFRKAMGFWGAEYELFSDQYGNFKVKITNWDKLRQGLNK